MQPICRLWANATLRAIRRGDPLRPGGNTRRQAVKLCAAGCLMLVVLFAGARPAAAAGICKDGRPEITVFSLYIDGHKLEIFVGLEGDKITGKMHANAAYPGETQMVGSVAGQFYPDKGMFLKIFLYPPAPAGAQLLIWGRFSEGSGQGEVRQTNWDDDVPNHTWIGMTAKGCAKWPEDVFRHELAQAAEAQADSAASALAAANPLYACDAGSWSPSSVGGLGQEFVSDCAKKIVGTLPWRDDGQLGSSVKALPKAMATGPGSMPWQACEAALSKRVSAITEAMQPTCEKAKRLQEAKNRCVPVHTTGDGRIYQNVPSAFTNEGKDVQLCMNEVQSCFDRNAGTPAQDSCAANVLGCFDFDTGNNARVGAARLFGAGGALAISGKNARGSRANIFCLSMRSASDASAFVSRKDWSILVGGSGNGRAVGNTYVDAASSGLWCQPRSAATSAILIRRASVSLAFADRLDPGNTRLVSLNSGDWCSPAATIPVVRFPSDGKVPPKLTNSSGATSVMKGSSGSDGSFAPQTPVKRTLQGGATAGRNESSSGTNLAVRPGCSSVMDRLSGDCRGGGVGSGSRLPDTSPGPRGSSGASTSPQGSSGASQSSSGRPQNTSGFDMNSSGVSVSRPQPQSSSSGVSMPVGGPGVSGSFGGSSSGTLGTNKLRNIEILKQQPPSGSESYRGRVN